MSVAEKPVEEKKPEEKAVRKPTSIETVSDMMQALQNEIDGVKDGTLEESKARIVLKGRGLQLKTAELQLQYARLTKGRIPDPELRLIKLPEPEK